MAAVSMIAVSCSPKPAGSSGADAGEGAADSVQTEGAAGGQEGEDLPVTDENGQVMPAEDVTGQEQAEAEAVPDSAVYDAESEQAEAEAGQPASDSEGTGAADPAQDEGEEVIPED